MNIFRKKWKRWQQLLKKNSATIQSISETIAAQNNSVKDILTEIDEIAGVSTKLEEHFDMEQAQCE